MIQQGFPAVERFHKVTILFESETAGG
jgi:hypothetical protein